MVVFMMLAALFGCDRTAPIEPTTQPVKTFPLVSGTFLQPWAFADHDVERMTAHLKNMKNVGIDLLIVQSTFTVNTSSSELSEKDMAFLAVLLESARNTDMQVFVGLANDGLWWKKVFTDQQWLDEHVKISLKGAKTIYDTYKTAYPDTLSGWYFWPEFWNMDLDEEQTARGVKFLSDYRDGLYAIDNSMPMLLSPYITDAVDAQKTEQFWTNILSVSTLRSGDIFCCQDSVGAGHVTLEQLDEYFAAMKNAAATKPDILFWANNEDFTHDFKSADMSRFLQQLEITHKYAATHISFSFCHYRNPDLGKQMAYDAYKHYFETGKLAPGNPAKPQVTVESVNRGLYVEFDISVDNSAGNIHSVVVTKDNEIIHTYVFGSDVQTLSHHFTDFNSNMPLCQKFYTVYSVDFSGNISEEFMETVNVYTIGL